MSCQKTTVSPNPIFWLIALLLMLVFNFCVMWKNWSDYNLSNRLKSIEQTQANQMQFNQAVQKDLKTIGAKIFTEQQEGN